MLKITKRTRKKDGRQIYYLSGTYQGQRFRESLGCSGRDEAQREFEKKRAEIIASLDTGADRNIKFAKAAADYLKEGEARFMRPIILKIGERPIAELSSGEIHDVARSLYPAGSPATRNRQVIAPVLAVINWAVERKLCAPVVIKRFKEPKTAPRQAIDRAWVDAFRDSAARLGWRYLGDMELFMFTTGARLGDAERLDWSAVDLERKTATLYDTKNRDTRVSLLTDEMVRSIRIYPERSGRVFGDWARRQMYPRWRAICEAAGIECVTPHQAGRHSFATEMVVRNGVDIPTTMKLGGWKSAKMLTEVYSHPENERGVAEAVFGKDKKPDLRLAPMLTPSIKKA
jgi:integrase